MAVGRFPKYHIGTIELFLFHKLKGHNTSYHYPPKEREKND